MNIDFHTHGRLSKKLSFDREYTDALFQCAKKSGLDAVCLTEHFNTVEFTVIYDYMCQYYEQQGDTFLYQGLRIYPGMEIDVLERGHTLFLGNYKEIVEFNQQLELYKEKGKFLPLEQLLKMAQPYEFIKGIAHPYREGCRLTEGLDELLKQFDFIDLNGKDVAIYGDVMRTKVKQLANELKLSVVGGSDTHQALQYGSLYTMMNEEISTIRKLKQEINAGNYELYINPEISYRVKAAGALKRTLKEIDALNGDYIQFAMIH